MARPHTHADGASGPGEHPGRGLAERRRLRREFTYHQHPGRLAAADPGGAARTHPRGARNRSDVHTELLACPGEPRAPRKPLGDDARAW